MDSGGGVKPGFFEGKAKSRLFDIIDKFRENGINEDISLPQVRLFTNAPLVISRLTVAL